MALGDGIRRNVANIEPSERDLLRDALLALNRRSFPGNKLELIPGGVTFWFKQDEIHQATHVHIGPEFVPWHRVLVNRFERMLRDVDSRLSLHYWDWTQDPRSIRGANLGNGEVGTLNLFSPEFMGYGGPILMPIGEPWLSGGFYDPNVISDRDLTGNPADPPRVVERFVSGSPATRQNDQEITGAANFPAMRALLQPLHDTMHGFVNMGTPHISFRDPFVFLLHSNVDRLYAAWQTQEGHPDRLEPATVYGTESGDFRLNRDIAPWSGIPVTVRPWGAPENEQEVKTYKHASVVAPSQYDTVRLVPHLVAPSLVSFGQVPQKDVRVRSVNLLNSGTASLRVLIEKPTPPPGGQPASGYRWSSFDAELAPGQEAQLTVRFSPQAEGAFHATVIVNSTGGNRRVRLSGRGSPKNVHPL